MARRGINKNTGWLISRRNNVKGSFLELIDNLLHMKCLSIFYGFLQRIGKLFIKGPIVNMLGIVGHTSSVRTTQLYMLVQKHREKHISQGISAWVLLIFWARCLFREAVLGTVVGLAVSLATSCQSQMPVVPPPIVTTKNVSRRCQMCPAGSTLYL